MRVQAGCHPSADLAAADKVLGSQKWRSAGLGGYYLDPHTSTYVAGILPEGGRALKAELGDLVTIDPETRVVPGRL